MTRGALYRTIDRLTDKGLLEWEMEPSDTPDRGGHPMRRLRVTRAGMMAVRDARDVLLTLFDAAGPALDQV